MANVPRIDLVHRAIRCGILGHIDWKDSAAKLVRDNPEMNGLTPEGIRPLLRQFVLEGGTLDARTETRSEMLDEDPDNPFWYRALIPVAGFPRPLFLEVKLIDEDEDEPWVRIVSCHF